LSARSTLVAIITICAGIENCAREAVRHRICAYSADQRSRGIRIVVSRIAGFARVSIVSRVAGIAGSRSNKACCAHITVGQGPSERAGDARSLVAGAIVTVCNCAGSAHDWRPCACLKVAYIAGPAGLPRVARAARQTRCCHSARSTIGHNAGTKRTRERTV
jgi:hypothetical protein